MKRYSLIFLVICANVLCGLQVQAADKINRQQIVVTEVLDGDTIEATLLNQKKNIRIRLAGIDCPEKSKKSGNFNKQLQEWQISEKELKEKGKQAKEKLEALVTLNAEDIYFEETPEKVCKGETRTVGVLWTGDGTNINEYMLKKTGCRPYSCVEK